jgi:magnesium chelatase family protein
VPWLPPDVLGEDGPQESSADIRERVVLARSRQALRFPETGAAVNARLSGKMLRRYARPDDAGRALLHSAIERLALSGRAHDRIMRVARSIADLAGRPTVLGDDVAEALQYRMG